MSSSSSSTHERERKLFDAVATLVQSSSVPSSTISDTTRLSLYGRYKRVVVGPLHDSTTNHDNPTFTSWKHPIEKQRPTRPSRFNLVAWYKYDAWERCDSLTDLQAMLEYVQIAADQENETGRECKRLLEEYTHEMELLIPVIKDQIHDCNRMNDSIEPTITTNPPTPTQTQTPTILESVHKNTRVHQKISTSTTFSSSFWKPLLPRGQLDIQYLDLFYAFIKCIFFLTWELSSRFLWILRSPSSIPSWIRYHDYVTRAWTESCNDSHSKTTTSPCDEMEDTEHDLVVGLSVRSLLDLYLSIRQYPPGSEIIITPPFNIESMIRVMQYHKLEVVPVDIHLNTGDTMEFDNSKIANNSMLPFKVDLSKIQNSISTKTVAIMIVHPFGTLCFHDEEMKQLHEIISKHTESSSRTIDILEDCAQCYSAMIYRGSPWTHIQFFSFGSIKTSTALGGGIAVIPRNHHLVTKMKEWQCQMYGQQTHVEYFIKVIKMTALHYISLHPLACGVILQLSQKLGLDYDQWITDMIRGFRVSSPSDQGQLILHPYHNLMKQLRRRPCLALLSLLRRRLSQWKQTQISVETRVARCRTVNQRLLKYNAHIRIPVTSNEGSIRQLYWLHPILVADATQTEREMRIRGFDVPRGTSQMKCISQYLVDPHAERNRCPNAEWMMQHVLYLPTASIAIRDKGIEELCAALVESTKSTTDLIKEVESREEDSRSLILLISFVVAILALQVNYRTLYLLVSFFIAVFVYSFSLLLCVLIVLRVLVGDYYIESSTAYSKYVLMGSEANLDASHYLKGDHYEDKWTMGPFLSHRQSNTILDIEALRVNSHLRLVEEESIQTRHRVLLSGATGFIGSLLLRDLLSRRKALNIDGGVVVICRSRKSSTAAERIRKLLDDSMFAFLSAEDKQKLVVVFEGDVTRPNLGLSETDYFRLSQSLDISHIIHCAASVSFTQSLSEAASSNITSSLHMQSLRKAMKNTMTKFIYVSTAFVHGNETGTIDEPLKEILYSLDPFDPVLIYESMLTTQVYAREAMTKLGFPNTYTLSKCVCEHLLARDDTGGPIIIFRPSIVGPSIYEPNEGWSGFYPSTLIASGCLFYKFQYLLWSFSNELVPVIPVDVVVKTIIAGAFARKEDDLSLSPRSLTTITDHEEVNGFEVLSSSESKVNGFHLIDSISTIRGPVIYNVVWNSSTRRQCLFSWYDYGLAILHNGCMKGFLTRPVAYIAIFIVMRALPFLNLSQGVYMNLHRGIVNVSIAFMRAYSWIRRDVSMDREKITQLRPFLDLPILFAPYTQHTFYFESDLTTTGDFNGERYMFSCVLAAERFLRSSRKTKSCDLSTIQVHEVIIPKKIQLLTDFIWALTQPQGGVIIRLAAFLMRQLFCLTGVNLTIDANAFSEISQAIDDLRSQYGETVSLVLAPTHRSLYDFLLISYVLFSLPEIQIGLPYIAAAEEFAALPVLGWFAQCCGAFFIKRGVGQADKQLGQRITQLKRYKRGKRPMCYEIFIEGKRSRDRVFIKPKTGVMK